MRHGAAWLMAVGLMWTGCSTAPGKKAAPEPSSASPTPPPSAPSSVSAVTTAGVTVSKADFLAQAKPVCDSLTSKVDALPDNAGKRLDALDQRAGYLTDALRRLRDLAPPPADEARVRSILDRLDTVRRDATDEAAALRAGDSATADRLEAQFDRDEESAKHAANAYGLGDCGA